MAEWRRRIADAVNGSTRRARGQRKRADHGFSIIEVVVTITLVSVAIIPLLDATFTLVRASSRAREAAEVETVLQNAADRVNRAPTQCNYDVFVQAAALSKGWQASQASATYKHYEPGSSALAADAGTWVDGACPGGVREPRLIQLVTITVASDTGSIVRSIQVVKSDV